MFTGIESNTYQFIEQNESRNNISRRNTFIHYTMFST